MSEQSAVEERLLKKLFALQDSAAVPENPRGTITYPVDLDAVLSADLPSVLARFGSSFYGLTSTKAAEALAQNGPNKLPEPPAEEECCGCWGNFGSAQPTPPGAAENAGVARRARAARRSSAGHGFSEVK